jgi:hypothetical protein
VTKFLLGLIMLAFCASCASAPRQYKEVKFEYYEVDFINRTRDLFLHVLCVSKFPPKRGDRCLYKDTPLFPRGYVLASGARLPYRKILYLKPGKYVISLHGYDLFTEKNLDNMYIVFDVNYDTELAISDKEVQSGKTGLQQMSQ